MSDVLPLVLVIPDEYLIVQSIRLCVYGQHIGGEPEQLGNVLDCQESQVGR
jgi:hypothetical protein